MSSGCSSSISASRRCGELRARGSSCRRRSAPRRRCSGTSRGPWRGRDAVLSDRAVACGCGAMRWPRDARAQVRGAQGRGRESSTAGAMSINGRSTNARSCMPRMRQRQLAARASDGGRIVANRGRASAARCAASRASRRRCCRRSIAMQAPQQRARRQRRRERGDGVDVVGLRLSAADRRGHVVRRHARATACRGAARARQRPRELAARMGEVAAQADEGDASPSFGRRRRRPARRRASPRPSRRLRPRPRERRRFFGASSGLQHRFALVVARVLEARPPVDERLRHLARRSAAQLEEIVGGAEPRVLEQPVRTRARPLLEARLQRPDLLDRRLEAARDRDPLGLALSTLSIASNSAGSGLLAACLGRVPVTSTSCHSSVANRNAGDTPLSSRTRASVPASAAR